MDVCFVYVYSHKYKALLCGADVEIRMNSRCTESLLAQLVRFQTAYELDPNIWWSECLVRM